MPVGYIHILSKHVTEYQEVIDIPVGHISQKVIEHLHHEIGDVLRKHALTFSLQATHWSLITHLMCSEPSMAINHSQFKKIKREDVDEDLNELLKLSNTTSEAN